MVTAVPQQGTGYLDEPQVVGGLLLVAHQDRSALREPAQCPLHHPPPRRVALLACVLVEPLLADPADVRHVVPIPHHLPRGLVVVAFVQTQVLRSFFGGLRTLDHDCVKRGGQQLVVAHVRPGNHYSQRSSVGLDQQGAFHPILAPVGGIGAREVPPNRALPIAPSAACHSQLNPPSSSHSSTDAAQIRSSTPSSTHRWKVRCTEESSGNSLGRWFIWQPVRNLKMIASRAARWSIRRRPVLLGGSHSARIGSIFSHNSSGTRQMVGRGFAWGSCSLIGVSSHQV